MTYYQPVKPLNRFWLCPLPAIDEGLACVPSGYQPPHVEPENQTLIERMLYSVNKTPEDAEWLSEYFADLPSYLTKYFAKRYIETHKEQGAQAANSYIREKMRPASERVKLVMDSYKHLPDSKKVASLRKRLDELDDEEQFNSNVSIFTSNKYQLGFDFDLSEKQKTKQKKQVKVRILAELELDELRDMAFTISNIVNKRAQLIGVQHGKETEEQLDEALPSIYEDVATLVRELGITPPRKYKEQTAESAITDISRMVCEKWWFGRLKSIRKIMREHLAIAMGQVSAKASPYASWDCIREHQETQKKNWEALQQRLLKDEETGEEAELSDTVLKSVSNPAIRRHELMTRCRGCEDVGNMLELQGLFLTLTTPSVFHNHYKKGSFIPHWNGASPRGAQEYLNNVWQRIRAKLGRDEIRWFGIRVAEPHHDGTPHWHLLIWVQPEHVEKVRDVFISYAIKEDKEELYPFFDRNEKRAAKKQSIQGPFNYRPRCDFGLIDPEKGTATGYIAKYISKNIDGFAMDGEVSDETGKSVQAMAKNVNAWKSRWGIRQFQFFGGAPVTTYRELRRFANQNKKAFMEYVFEQERSNLITIYLEAYRDLVGPFKPADVMENAELLKAIADNYQPCMETDNTAVTDTMKAADNGHWKGYIMGQGGPFVKREDLLITNSYEVLPFASPHGEDVRKIEGFVASGDLVKTRLRTWTITKKTKKNTETVYEFDKPSENPITWRLKGKKVTSKETIEAEAGALAPALDLALSGISDSSRSSVNNCTPSQKVQVSDQLKRLLEPYSVGGGLPPNIDDSALIALQQGSSIRIDDETSIRIRPAEHLPCGTVRPAQLVEEYQPKPDLSWLDDFEAKQPEPLTGEDENHEYQQPNLSDITVSKRPSKSWADYLEIIESDEWPIFEE
ncbi:replication endonuclease [Vibrio atlanticus]|uniref:Bacteriophage replication gene A protein (GPA) n=1 Tax=Vibrio atlanticus TaxID=693153 RepID=A0A1C3IW19_9VIBR|nr:replication endonuclease [Vibrio atlanticus]SBS65518.1 Bacteriophage replication gene A protein (GPA) [Vibrio atlanticus]